MAVADLRPATANGDYMTRQRRVSVRGIELSYHEWGRRRGPTILMLHATGFHARCWDGVIRSLGDGCHVVAVDQRGHGRSSKLGPYEWSEFGADAIAFVEALDLVDVIGVGHSMGGHVVVQAAAGLVDRFRSLLLVDPVIMDPVTYRSLSIPASPRDHPVSRRRNRWQSVEEMVARFGSRSPFSVWKPEVLADYCRYGLNRDGDGFVLGCPPLVEASIYAGSSGHDASAAIAAIPHPVVVLRARRTPEGAARHDFTRSPTWEGLADAFANGRDVYLPELTHFIPMQAPDRVAGELRALMD